MKNLYRIPMSCYGVLSQMAISDCNNVLGTDLIFGCSAIVAIITDGVSIAHYFLCHASPFTDAGLSLKNWINSIVGVSQVTFNVQIRYQDCPGIEIFEDRMENLKQDYTGSRIKFDCQAFRDEKKMIDGIEIEENKNTSHGMILLQAESLDHVNVDELTHACVGLYDKEVIKTYVTKESEVADYMQNCVTALGNIRNSRIRESQSLSNIEAVRGRVHGCSAAEAFQIKSQPPILIFDNRFLSAEEIIDRYSFDGEEGKKILRDTLIDPDTSRLRESPGHISSGFVSDESMSMEL